MKNHHSLKNATALRSITKIATLLAVTIMASKALTVLAVTESDQFNTGDNNIDANNSIWYFTSGQAFSGSEASASSALVPNLLTGSTVTGSAADVGLLSGINDLSVCGSTSGGANFGNGYNEMAYYGNTQFGSSIANNAVVTFTVTLGGGSPSANGYNLSQISVYNAWGDHASFADQHYTISLSTDGVNYTPFYSVNYMPFLAANDNPTDGGQDSSTLVTLSSLNVTGIKDLRFAVSAGTDANNQQQEGQLFQEITAFGTATPVPEPSTWTLLIGGFSSLGFIGVRRNAGKI